MLHRLERLVQLHCRGRVIAMVKGGGLHIPWKITMVGWRRWTGSDRTRTKAPLTPGPRTAARRHRPRSTVPNYPLSVIIHPSSVNFHSSSFIRHLLFLTGTWHTTLQYQKALTDFTACLRCSGAKKSATARNGAEPSRLAFSSLRLRSNRASAREPPRGAVT